MSGPKKSQPHHPLKTVKTKFSTENWCAVEFTSSAIESARDMGFSMEDMIDVIQTLCAADFIGSAPSNNPPHPGCWHDIYEPLVDGKLLYLKFAGSCGHDLRLTSFREAL